MSRVSRYHYIAVHNPDMNVNGLWIKVRDVTYGKAFMTFLANAKIKSCKCNLGINDFPHERYDTNFIIMNLEGSRERNNVKNCRIVYMYNGVPTFEVGIWFLLYSFVSKKKTTLLKLFNF